MLGTIVILLPLCIILLAILSIKYISFIRNWIKQFVFKKVGLRQLDEIKLSFKNQNRGPPLIIHIKGIQICIQKKQQPTTKVSKASNINKRMARLILSFLSLRIPKAIIQFLLDIPIHLIMSGVATYVALHIDNLEIEKDNITLKVDHIYFDSKLGTRLFQEKFFAVGVQIGPLKVVAQSSVVLFGMTTACLVTISFYFKAARLSLEDLDLDIQLGKMNLNINECFILFNNSKNSQNTSINAATPTSTTIRLEEILSSIRVTAQYICFIYSATLIEINNINSSVTFLRHTNNGSNKTQAPIVQLNTELIQCKMLSILLFTMPSMEIKASQSDHHPSSNNHHAAQPPQTEFIRVTWILDSPNINIPLNNAELMDLILASNIDKKVDGNKKNGEKSSQQQLEKVLPDLPMCTFALVLNSPKLELSQIDNQGRCGYITTSSLIIRISGEYLIKGRNSNTEDVPSSSSSSGSGSNLDVLFAQEEYQWLRKSSGNQQQQQRPTSATRRLVNLMGRVSRRQNNSSISGSDSTTTPSQRIAAAKTRGWTYRVSVKIILHRYDMGYYMKNSNRSPKQFVRVKNAVLIFKTRMNVMLSNMLGYETILSLYNIIQSEVAIDKPVINICDDQEEISASIFWIKLIPQYLASIGRKGIRAQPIQQQSQTTTAAISMQLLVRNFCFSLEVTHGCITAICLDRSHKDVGIVSPPTPPNGYIDNTPTETTVTRLMFETRKFNLVFEGPAAAAGETNRMNGSEEWNSRCHMDKLYIQQSSDTIRGNNTIENIEEKQQHVILLISQLSLTAKYNHAAKQAIVTTAIKKYSICYSIRNYYTLLLLAKSLLSMKNQNGSSNKKKDKEPTTNTPSLAMNIQLSVARGDISICLPKDTRLYLRMDDFSLQHESTSTPLVKFRNLMLLGVSPLHPESWEQLVEIDKTQISIKNGNHVELKARKIFATIPYNYVLSAVIDNVIGLVKAIKELHSRILSRNAFTFFGPTVNNDPILIPTIHIKAKVFTVHFDDDPFEAKLRHILRTGLVEQQKRLAYREALDDKIQEMLSSAAAAAAAAAPSSTTATSDSFSSVKQQSDSILLEENATLVASPSPDLEWIHSQITDAEKNLLGYYSKFWIKNINEAKTQEINFYQDLHTRESYRNFTNCEELDQSLDEPHRPESTDFIIDIRSRPLHPPLANFSAQFAKVSFKPADFSLSETRYFINEIGGGVPLDNDFSIIIPFHLSIKAGKTWIKMRDYPLPLLYVPQPAMASANNDNSSITTESGRSRVSWTLEGNYAIGDELGNSGGSRIIPIPILPPSSGGATADSLGYCLSAVRTASPLKFYSVIDYHVLTKSMSTICWSVSYNPAIQDIIRVLDTLTAAQVDPSPRIGFWDKVRLMIHTQTKISFIGGGDLAFVFKGTRDPYQLQGRGAGIAKVWSDNVVWLLGYKNPQNEFMQILSRTYAFGVPDLARGGYVPSFPDSLEKKKKRRSSLDNDSIEYSKFLKVALKLSNGIRMGIGMHFERLGCDLKNGVCFKCASAHRLDRCRTQIFSPHYNVIYQSIQQVEAFYDKSTYDAFIGFRSDFIHLSFSIVKLQNGDLAESPDFSRDDPYFTLNGVVSQNAMYLSPCFIEHFLQWFGLFGSPVSLPVRQGILFPRDEGKSESFGDYLNTIKYKIVINPLAIGFFCTDDGTYINVKGGGSAGLKARVNAFSVDLHSRKEIVRSPDNKKAAKTETNFHELEVELHDIDLRVIKATQVRSSKLGESGEATNAKSSSASPSAGAYNEGTSFEEDEDSDDESVRSYSFQWVDPKDYVILDSVPHMQQNNVPRRKAEVHPFAFSPLFYYVKQNDEAGTEKRDYLRGTHDCIMGKGMDSHEFQKTHLNRRGSDLDKIIENHDKQLDVILNALNNLRPHHDKKTLYDQHNLLMEKLDYLRTNRYILHTYIAQLILETELNMTPSSPTSRDSPHTTTSSLGRRDELSRWEMLMGQFKDRFFIHNPQIIWNNSVRDAIYYWQDIKSTRSVQDYNLSARCLKFLEDLVHTAEKQQQWKPDVPSSSAATASLNNTNIATTDDDNINKSTTQALIDKLLSERSHNFVAYNEKEEDKKRQQQQNYDGIHVFENNSENVNDPDYQYKNIPESYEMKSKYLIDMINPQVNFQSEKGLNHLILFTNERIHVKAFGIIDNSSSSAADKDVRLVKDRIIVSLDNAQLMVAKRMEFLSFDLLTQSCYGQCQNSHWTAWVQPEQLWYYKDMKYFDNFQRVASQLSGNIQLDRYNHLRIKINKYNTSRKSPFEDRTNTMQLHFPQFKLTLNSQQAHILYYTLTNLLLGNDGSPKKKERLNRSKDVMLAAERSDLAETVTQVGILQNRSRALLDMHKRFMLELPYLDQLGMREFNRNKKKMRENIEKLYLVVEAIRSIQTFRRDIHLEETDNAMRFCFTSDNIVWEAVMDDPEQSSLCTWTLNNIKYVRLNKINGSSKNTIEVDKMQILNTTDTPVFTNVLDAYIEPGGQQDFSRQKMLRGVLESLPPVGGIPVIQHLEINVIPLSLQISTAFGSAMKDYFFPRIINGGDASDYVSNDSNINEDQDLEEDEYDQDEDEYDEERGEEQVSAVDGLNLASRSSSKTDLLSLGGGSVDKSNASILSSNKREGSFASFDMITQKVKETVVMATAWNKKAKSSDELTVMKNRSSTNRTFIYVRVPATKHCLSLQGPSHKTFYNLYNFPFKQPKLEYRNKTWSLAEMMEEIQRQFVRAILRHSPALIRSKLMMINRQNINAGLSTPSSPTDMLRLITNGSRISTTSAFNSRIDLMDDSVIYNRGDNLAEAETTGSSYQTEEEEEGGFQQDYYEDDLKSVYSVDPEEEEERLAELQLVDKRISLNVDKGLLDAYMKKYKKEAEIDELVRKGRILLGDSYNGSFYPPPEAEL